MVAYKKALRALTAIFAVVGVVSILAHSQKAYSFSGSGAGTSSDPYQITNCAQLQSISEDAVYWLANDIDCTGPEVNNGGLGFNPIDNFYGTLDGRGHTISGLYINRPDESEVGLFSRLESGFVLNLAIDYTSTIIGQNTVGSVAGFASYSRLIAIKSTAQVSGLNQVGGLIGRSNGFNQGDMLISRSIYTGALTASTGSAGGLIGSSQYGYTVKDSAVNAAINGTTAGGIIGRSVDACGYRYIQNVAAMGTVNGSSTAGGLVGELYGQSCHQTAISDSMAFTALPGNVQDGGLFGSISGTSLTESNLYFSYTVAETDSCYGFTNSASPVCSDLGSNVPPADEPYNGWDFDQVWELDGSIPYPVWPIGNTLYGGPAAPSNLNAQEGGSKDVVNITWDASSSSSDSDFDGYRYQIKQEGYSWDNLHYSGTTSSTDATVDNLTLGNTYNIRIQAKNAYGGGEWVEINYDTPVVQTVTITNCQQLDDFDEQHSNFDNISLQNDIDCSSVEDFRPIGFSDEWAGAYYRGTFNGSGYKIQNLTISDDSICGGGLFAYMYGATVKNVSFVGGQILGECYMGVIAGEAYNVTLENITSNVNVTVTDYQAGGLIGYLEYEDTSTDFNLTGLSYTGEVQSPSSNIGGLFGEVRLNNYYGTVTLSKSYVEGTINGSSNVGGLIGQLEVDNDNDDGDPASNFVLQDSYNRASVNGSEYNVGGLFGYVQLYNDGYDSEANLTISRTYNSGTISAVSDNAGGLIGQMDGMNDDYLNLVINDSFGVGEVSAANYDFALVGGTDWISDGSFTPNNNRFDITATGQVMRDYYDGVDNGYGVNSNGSQSDYFKYNSENPPLNNWDFSSVWRLEEADFPKLRALTFTDLNGDEIDDSEQPNIGGYTNPDTGKIVAMDVGENCELIQDDMAVESLLPVQDENYDYQYGLFDFAGDCGDPGFTTTISLYYYDVDPSNLIVRKYNPITNQYSTLSGASVESRQINGRSVAVLSYQLTDGGELDTDGEVNGEFEDPVGLASAISSSSADGNSGILATTGSSVTLLIVFGLALVAFSALRLKLARSKYER